jgi:uncharacterized membrane protein YjdF
MTKEIRFVQMFTIVYIIFFAFVAISNERTAFLFHTTFIGIITCFISFYYEKMHLTKMLVVMLSIFGLLHLIGAILYLDGIRMYEYPLFWGMHFDNLVHSTGGAVAALVGHNFLQNHLDDQMKHHPIPFIFLLITFAAGLGTYNEIAELMGVLFFNAAPFVGGYINNAFDLIFNILGAFVASTAIYIHRYRKAELKDFQNSFNNA